MSFNQLEFNSQKSVATDRKLKSLSHVYNFLVRAHSPMRGFMVKYSGRTEKAVKEYSSLLKVLFNSIKKSNYPEATKNALITGETFQSTQKGPTAPVSRDDIQETVISKLEQIEAFEISDDFKNKITLVARSLFDYFGESIKINLRLIDFEKSGSELPSSSTRGFPFHDIGKNVDHEIIRIGGKTYHSAFEYFASATQNVCFPGWRIQGAQGPGPAKVRIVNIPQISYQYLMTGITKTLMHQLKHFNMFAGWQSEDDRRDNMINVINQSMEDDFILIQLDYSKFDRKIHSFIRILIGDLISEGFSDSNFAQEFRKAYRNYAVNQSIFVGDVYSKSSRNILLPYQLLSGIIDTQLTGSITNAILQGVCAEEFGYTIPGDYVKVLGDDAVFPVPKSLFEEIGYSGVVERISRIVDRMGFTVNAKKAYPTPDVAFLQKLYIPSLDINGIGSGARSINSFMFREKHAKPIPGVRSIYALEIISQISIISQVYAPKGVVLEDFSQHFADGGISNDEGFRYIIQKCKSSSSEFNENTLFKYLIKLTGVGIEGILDGNDSISYDHTDFASKLHSTEFADVFPILKYIVKSSRILEPVREKISGKIDEALTAGFKSDDHVDFLED